MTDKLDEVIHAPTRIGICGQLMPVVALEFGILRDSLDVADSVLSKHLKVLTEAGYVHTERRPTTLGRPHTWISLTPSGRTAVHTYITQLNALLASEG